MDTINRQRLELLGREAVKSGKKILRLKDVRVKGFFWQANNLGKVVAVLRYDISGSNKVFTVAEFGDGINQFKVGAIVSMARKHATDIKRGGDPQAQYKLKKFARKTVSKARKEPRRDDDVYVTEKADEYYLQNTSLPSSKVGLRRSLSRISNAIGHKRVKDVTKQDIINLLTEIQGMGKYSMVREVQKTGQAMWNWGNDVGGFNCDAMNYFSQLKTFKAEYRKLSQKNKNNKSMTENHVAEFVDKHIPSFFEGLRRASIMQAYTLVRAASVTYASNIELRGPIYPLDWGEINLKDGIWHLKAIRMKGRERDHIIDLPTQLIEHLLAWRKADGYPVKGLITRSKHEANKPLSPSTMASGFRMRKIAHTPHKWRHLGGSWIAEKGGKEIADLILSHYTTDAYLEATRREDRKVWLQKWANHLDTLGFDKLREKPLQAVQA